MSEERKRSRLVVDLPEEDRAWVRAQSEATGWNSEALVVRMLIKDAREKGLGFAVVAQSPKQPGIAPIETAMRARYPFNSPRPAAVEADFEAPPPVADEEVENLLADRLGEKGIDAAALATEPWPDLGAPAMAGLPAPAVNGGVAVSLEPAPQRGARASRYVG